MLQILDYRPEHLVDTIRAFDTTWGWELRGENDEKLALATFYVTHALAVSNVRRLAFVDGTFAGLMLGTIPSLTNPYHDQTLLTDMMEHAHEALTGTETGRETIAMYEGIDAVNEALLKSMLTKGLTWEASMNLLIALPQFIGQGVGRGLVSSYFGTLSENHVNHVILYTDDHCNYRYYDRHGWERAAEETWLLANEPIHAIAYRKAV